MWAFSHQCWFASASRQRAPGKAVEMSYKYTSVKPLVKLPYPFEADANTCECQVDFSHIALKFFLHSFSVFVTAADLSVLCSVL